MAYPAQEYYANYPPPRGRGWRGRGGRGRGWYGRRGGPHHHPPPHHHHDHPPPPKPEPVVVVRPGIGMGLGMGVGMGVGRGVRRVVRANNRQKRKEHRKEVKEWRAAQHHHHHGPHHHHHHPQHSKPEPLRKGYLEIEYNVLVKFYKRKYFVIHDDATFHYFDSQKSYETHEKPEKVLYLSKVTKMKKVDHNIVEVTFKNESSILSSDTTDWRFKSDSTKDRDEWFQMISLFAANKNEVVYVEEKDEKQNDNQSNGVVTKATANSEGTNVTFEPGMPGYTDNGAEDKSYAAPPAYNPEFGQNDDNNMVDGNQYGDEGKVTNQ